MARVQERDREVVCTEIVAGNCVEVAVRKYFNCTLNCGHVLQTLDLLLLDGTTNRRLLSMQGKEEAHFRESNKRKDNMKRKNNVRILSRWNKRRHL